VHRSLPAAFVTLALAVWIHTMTPPASASAGWVNVCRYSHSAMDDPIVYPRRPGASHLHDFFGASRTNARSTLRTMREGTTTCEPRDTAGYWVPALYERGHRVLPRGPSTRQQFYYREADFRTPTRIRPYPAGMKLIAGNARATSAAGNPGLGDEIYWGCSDNEPGGKFTHPISCRSGIISLHVGFPSCWNGRHLSMAAHPKAVIYPEGGRCPTSHPVALPRLIERFEYPVGRKTRHIRLASGPSYTAHGDFWNTWNQRALKLRVHRCLNRDRNCGQFPR
jgi:hypothetical protein